MKAIKRIFGVKNIDANIVNGTIIDLMENNPYTGSVVNGYDGRVQEGLAQVVMMAYDRAVSQDHLNQVAEEYLREIGGTRAVHKYIIMQVVVTILEKYPQLSDKPLERVTEALYRQGHTAVDSM